MFDMQEKFNPSTALTDILTFAYNSSACLPPRCRRTKIRELPGFLQKIALFLQERHGRALISEETRQIEAEAKPSLLVVKRR